VSSSKRKSLDNIYSQTTKPLKMRRNIRKYKESSKNLNNDENALKIERIKRVMEEEEGMANLRKTHENRMILKENFQKDLYDLEIRAATANVELDELQLQKEK